MVANLAVPEPERAIALCFKPSIASRVVVAQRVLAAVAFDDHLWIVAGEIGDVGPTGTCRRNFRPSSLPPRSICQSAFSAGVRSLRIARARSRSSFRSGMWSRLAWRRGRRDPSSSHAAPRRGPLLLPQVGEGLKALRETPRKTDFHQIDGAEWALPSSPSAHTLVRRRQKHG
jgi:hypothetical protein